MEIEVALPTPVPGTFTYECEGEVSPGARVVVPFGARKMVGVVMGLADLEKAKTRDFKVKKVSEILDPKPIYSDTILKIARWLSWYYIHPLGEVLRTMLPASSAKVNKKYELTEKGRQNAELSKLFGKRSALSAVVLKTKIKTLSRSLEDIVAAKLVRTSELSTVSARLGNTYESVSDANSEPEEKKTLTPAQTEIFVQINERGIQPAAAAKPFLLWGVTGSGKTEIYLQLIAEVFARHGEQAQVLVLVPEISLTPQMTRVFAERFPGKTAVVHSALSDPERWQQLERVRAGAANILIGPRSAVFAPFADLKLIVVDEEHDGSYKQATGLTYNGRDVAILRGKLEKACVVLGSATPSLESFENARKGKYELLQLKERVQGRALPTVSLIQHKPAFSLGAAVGRGAIGSQTEIAIADEILEALRENIKDKKQAIVLVNRRGFAYYLLSLNEKKAVTCPNCSISLTLHKRSTVMRCHYCEYKTTTADIIAAHPNDQFLAVGYGSEKVEVFLSEKLPGARIQRLDSDTTSKKDVLQSTLAKFRQGDIDILVGTQMLAKGHDFPKVTLIVILDVEQQLNLPDFRAGERTFQLLVQASGRAGRAEHPGRVLIQTGQTTKHPVIMTALNQDYETFANNELAFRSQYRYPPYTKLVSVEINSTDQRALSQYCARIQQWFEKMGEMDKQMAQKVKISGPTIPPIETIRLRHRRSILFSAAEPDFMWRIVNQFLDVFQKAPGDIRVKVDVDPQSLI